MTPATIVDTGPLVALLNRNDADHARCLDLFTTLVGTPLLPTTVMGRGLLARRCCVG